MVETARNGVVFRPSGRKAFPYWNKPIGRESFRHSSSGCQTPGFDISAPYTRTLRSGFALLGSAMGYRSLVNHLSSVAFPKIGIDGFRRHYHTSTGPPFLPRKLPTFRLRQGFGGCFARSSSFGYPHPRCFLQRVRKRLRNKKMSCRRQQKSEA